MDDETRVLVGAAKPAVKTSERQACLVFIYPTGSNVGARLTLAEKPVIIGRDDNCDIRVNDDSVSRRHACVQPGPNGYDVVDLQSTNGTYVNDARILTQTLKDGDYLRIGNGIFRFLAGGNLEAEYHEEIYRLTIVDALTEIHNKRFFLEFLSRSLSCACRYRRPLSMIMFDIDHFKPINDQLGHLGGDFTLRELASVVKKSVRKDDLFARYGGEEFAIVMPETELADGRTVAESIRTRIEAHPFEFAGRVFPVTISLGLSSTAGEEWVTATEFIRQADENLYQAKRQGRNRTIG
jgi:diguanylate cyclase (GGDEF)-like protein